MKNLNSLTVIIAALFFLSAPHIHAQSWDWAVSVGGKEKDYASSMVSDAQGNTYITGSFTGTATFGLTQLKSPDYYDIFIAKYDPSGALVWISQAGGTEGDESNGIAIDANNNIYITGFFAGIANFGKLSVKSKGGPDFFVAKYTSEGQPIWVRSGGSDQGEYGSAIALDNKGNILVTGTYSSTAAFENTSIKSEGSEDIFITNYTPDGDLKWVTRIGGKGNDGVAAIATDAQGNAFITGWFSGVVDFGKTRLTSNGGDDIFIAKINSSGDIDWAAQAGGDNEIDRSNGIAVDSKSNCYVTGSINGSAKFGDNILISEGPVDYFLAKYDTNGALQFVKQSGGKDGEIGKAIALDTQGNIYVCGQFNATFAVNSTQSSVGEYDVFIAKYSANGNLLGGNHAGGEGYDHPAAISFDANNNCYVLGEFTKTCLFGIHEVINRGNADIFLAKTKSFNPVY